MSAPNRNLLWAEIFVDELARNGLQAVSLAPGSRNTPLVIAFAQHPSIKVYSHIDERSAAFFALGLALASDRPVAVVCSSGTATANFFPAVIEAHYSRVPLLVLTADRPPEVRDSGANQTVDQVKLYGDHVLWAVDVALPEGSPAPVTLRSLRTLAARAYATADGMPKGAVHLNFPFRKPLEPLIVETDQTDAGEVRHDGIPFTRISRGYVMPTTEQISLIVDAVKNSRRGAIYAGSRAGDLGTARAILDLGELLNFPVFADPLSNVRFVHDNDWVIGGYDTFLRADKALDPPDLVLMFGGMPTSQALDDWLNRDAIKTRILISGDGVWTDPNHRIDALIQADPAEVCRNAAVRMGNRTITRDYTWVRRILESERTVWECVATASEGAYFDGMVVADVIDLLPENAAIFVSNSLAVRHLDQFARPNGKQITVYCNRGASGIDGVISSALGVAAANPDQPLVLIIGDVAFYHDMNGLLALRRNGINATIVLLNNNGGGIFYRLPIKDFDPPFTELFLTPHDLDFAHAAALYGLPFTRAADRAAFRAAFAAAIGKDAHVIEVPTDFQQDDTRRREVIAHAEKRIKLSDLT